MHLFSEDSVSLLVDFTSIGEMLCRVVIEFLTLLLPLPLKEFVI